MSSIFPMLQPPQDAGSTAQSLPLCREAGWDFERNRPLFRRGEPVVVTGREAVRVWAWRALHTPRLQYEIFSTDYGSDFEALMGQAYTPELKEAEVPRYLRECLMINPYITEVQGIRVSFQGDKLSVACTAATIYGEVELNASI